MLRLPLPTAAPSPAIQSFRARKLRITDSMSSMTKQAAVTGSPPKSFSQTPFGKLTHAGVRTVRWAAPHAANLAIGAGKLGLKALGNPLLGGALTTGFSAAKGVLTEKRRMLL